MAETGFYVEGLEAKVMVKGTDGKEKTLIAQEQKGVAGYYEAKNIFTQEGEHLITFQSGIDEIKKIVGTFKKVAIDKEKIGYWYKLLGKAVVPAAAIVTLIGTVLSLSFRAASRH